MVKRWSSEQPAWVEDRDVTKTIEMDAKMSAYEQSVHLRETGSGHWIVHDEMNRKGGRFVDRRAAMNFIRRELGLRARAVSAAQNEDAAFLSNRTKI